MFNAMGFDAMEMYECTMTIDTDGKIQTNRLAAPRIIIENHFADLLRQAMAAQIPVMIKLSRTELVWSQYDLKNHNRDYYIQFKNSHYIRANGDKE